MKNNDLKAHLAIFVANFMYGANFTIAKEVMLHYIKPMGFILLRVTTALILFWIVGLFIKDRKIERSDFKRIIFCGLFGVAINQLLFFKGLNITFPINASIVMIMTPILVVVFAHFLIKEKISFQKITGIILGVMGAILIIVVGKTITMNGSTALGDFFILINATSYAIYMIIAKPLMLKYKTITVIKWVFLIGWLFVFPFGFSELNAVEWNTFSTHIWWATTFVVIGTTFLAYFLNTYALRDLSPSIVSFYIYLQPLVASFIAVYYGRDSITIVKIISAALIFTGVYLVSKKSSHQKSMKTAQL
jgi:drug/metabolite transporter (DMT)-like permease